MSAPDSIRQLVQHFEEQRATYRSEKYKETQVRSDFLDPFFEALGWDVANRSGYAEKYREVIQESSVEMEGQAKAADYAFRLGDKALFLLEAKKPAVNIETHPEPAFQVRRYGWSAKLAINILSNFEQLAVYDCRSKPKLGDPPSLGRVKLVSFREYVEKWDEISAIFARQAALKGSFDQFAEGMKGKRGTTEVDDAFLEEMERWRLDLARSIALRNPALSSRQVNTAVQTTIDRIIFLRICEERGIEAEDALRSATDGIDVYQDLVVLFKQADQKYNSGLFHFSDEKGQSSFPDTLTLNLKIDDKVLKDILAHLYYPLSPYAFKYISVDILGQVYERFLGKVIRLTAGHQAKVEEKPEVRKAGGVYYTPTYIVKYIVQNTLGELLKDQNAPDQKIKPVRVLDPACGSGSFLLGAYQYLLDWYLDWYSRNEPARWARGKAPALIEGRDGWQLTMDKKKEILLNHIYGVDIDAQAVEVTKLSLLLRVVENPGQLSLLGERILPDLGQNIKCGNSLIGPDYYDNQQLTMFDSEEQHRVNAFDWLVEFPKAFASGGFDAVIGNPPYVRQEGLGQDKEYYQSHYETFLPTSDLYVNFLEKGLHLLKISGLLGMIVSNKWLRAAYGRPLREFLKNKSSISQIIDLAGLPVFENATVRTIIMIYSPKTIAKSSYQYLAPLTLAEFRTIRNGEDLDNIVMQKSKNLLLSHLSPEGWSFTSIDSQRIMEKINYRAIPLPSYINGKLYRGLITGLNQAFIIDSQTRDKLIAKDPKNGAIIKPLVGGRDVRRYSLEFKEKYLIWTYIGVPINEYPVIFEHLKQYQPGLQKRWDKGNYWWELRACDYYEKFPKPKIIYPDIATNCRFYLDKEGFYSANTTYFIPSEDLYLLGTLNSKLAQFYFSQVCAGLEGGNSVYLRFFGEYMEKFPVRTINFSDPADAARHARMVGLVEGMLALHKRQAGAQLPQEKETLQRQIQATDGQIDRLVYELYGLTEEEIKIVEGL
jgi:hypothetical protein